MLYAMMNRKPYCYPFIRLSIDNKLINVMYRESFMPISSGLLPNLPPIFARFTSYNSSGIPLILSRSL